MSLVGYTKTGAEAKFATKAEVAVTKGDPGVQGPQGIQGPPGSSGAQGPTGPKGDKGDTGNAGAAGPTGAKGDTGDVGPAGATGAAGAQGAQGIQGVKGDTGDVGPAGAAGAQGAQGIQGVKGDTGDVGPAGAAGAQGATGPQGYGTNAPRVNSTATSATPTPNTDTTDHFYLTGLLSAATFGAPTGTPNDGQHLLMRIKDNGTARALSWNAAYLSGPGTLLTTTVAGKTHLMSFIYDAALTKWVCVAAEVGGH
jgi:hypothetical protein